MQRKLLKANASNCSERTEQIKNSYESLDKRTKSVPKLCGVAENRK
ncbi:MAG: hypothetical protein LBK94_08800 [Prevotellaceae bacterium]|nr:hypothetical protein [Prevotellaceae bacterium]